MSTIYRTGQFVYVSSKRLRILMERDLSDLQIVALFIDGKRFAEDAMMIAIGVATGGKGVYVSRLWI